MRKRLATRIAMTFGLWAVVLAVLYGGLVIGLATTTQQRLLEDVLTREAEQLSALESHRQEIWRPANPLVQSAVNLEDLRARLPEGFDPATPGFQELHGENGEEYYAVSMSPQDPSKLRVLFLNISETRSVSRHIDSYVQFLAQVVFGVILLTAGLSFWVGRRIARPITALTDLVAGRPLAALPQKFAHDFGDDEVGALAGVIETSLADARAALEREREFNHGVSHELRSALQVADHAAELIRLNPDLPPNPDVVARLDRALETMRNSAEAFLWLARPLDTPRGDVGRDEAGDAKNGLEPDEYASIADAIRATMTRQESAAHARGVTLEADIRADAEIAAPAAVAEVVVANLLRNAISHTSAGTIRITLDAQALTIVDEGTGLDSHQLAAIESGRAPDNVDGFGLGLVLCRRLCARFGWDLSLESDGPGLGTTARIRFCAPQPEAAP